MRQQASPVVLIQYPCGIWSTYSWLLSFQRSHSCWCKEWGPLALGSLFPWMTPLIQVLSFPCTACIKVSRNVSRIKSISTREGENHHVRIGNYISIKGKHTILCLTQFHSTHLPFEFSISLHNFSLHEEKGKTGCYMCKNRTMKMTPIFSHEATIQEKGHLSNNMWALSKMNSHACQQSLKEQNYLFLCSVLHG